MHGNVGDSPGLLPHDHHQPKHKNIRFGQQTSAKKKNNVVDAGALRSSHNRSPGDPQGVSQQQQMISTNRAVANQEAGPHNTVRSNGSEFAHRQPNHILMQTNTFKTMQTSPHGANSDADEDDMAALPPHQTIHLPSYADLNSIHQFNYPDDYLGSSRIQV